MGQRYAFLLFGCEIVPDAPLIVGCSSTLAGPSQETIDFFNSRSELRGKHGTEDSLPLQSSKYLLLATQSLSETAIGYSSILPRGWQDVFQGRREKRGLNLLAGEIYFLLT